MYKTKYCPYCHSTIPFDYDICPVCHMPQPVIHKINKNTYQYKTNQNGKPQEKSLDEKNKKEIIKAQPFGPAGLMFLFIFLSIMFSYLRDLKLGITMLIIAILVPLVFVPAKIKHSMNHEKIKRIKPIRVFLEKLGLSRATEQITMTIIIIIFLLSTIQSVANGKTIIGCIYLIIMSCLFSLS